MQSVRERLLQALTGALTQALEPESVRVVRSPTVGVDRESAPALLLVPESDAIAERPNDRVERHLVVRLIAVARDTDIESGMAIADRVLVIAHRALFAAPLGGLCLGLRELDTDFEVEDADASACALPARYEFRYRTFAHDLSQPG